MCDRKKKTKNRTECFWKPNEGFNILFVSEMLLTSLQLKNVPLILKFILNYSDLRSNQTTHPFFPRRWIYFQSFPAPEPPAALLPLCSLLLQTDVFVSGAFQTGKSPVAGPETRVRDVTCAALIFGVVPSKSLCRGSRVWINSQFHISDKLQGKY